MTRAYEQFVEFISSGPSAKDVAAWKASRETNDRVTELLDRERDGILTTEEHAELGHYLEVEHLMRLAKARARERCGC